MSTQQQHHERFEVRYQTPWGLEYDGDRDEYRATSGSEIDHANAFTFNEWYKLYKYGAEDRQAEIDKLLTALNEIAWRRHPSEKCSAAVEKLEKIALQAIANAGVQL